MVNSEWQMISGEWRVVSGNGLMVIGESWVAKDEWCVSVWVVEAGW